MISLRKTFYSKLILIILVFILCIFYIRNLNGPPSSVGKPVSLQLHQQPPLLSNEIDETENQLVNSINDETKINKYELEIQRDLAKQREDPQLGAGGKMAHLTDPEDVAAGELQLSKIALNEELSNHISFNRTVPDARHPACRSKKYDIESLPTASVVIIFFNEPYSVLVRTVHSVINTTPKRLLKEVILVDDGSSNVELKGKLDYYVKTRFSDNDVKVLRLKNR